VVLLASALCGAACTKGTPSGVLVGKYAVKGSLIDNTCGQAALPASNPLNYVVSLRDNNGTATWAPDKSSAAGGSLSGSGSFNFETQLTRDMGTTVQANTNLQTGDLLTPGSDPDLIKRHCIMVTIDTLAGVIHKRLADPSWDAGDGAQLGDASTTTSTAASTTADLTGDETVQVMAATGADCTAALAIAGGPYTVLPCGLHYRLEGTLQPAQ
jgi:hypothetical protein